MSQKRIYTQEFKLKVLEYFLKHGGNNTFGLKTKTANHFSIDHKTVARIALNTDLIKKARETINNKKNNKSSKSSGSSNVGKAKRIDSSKKNKKNELQPTNSSEATVVDLPEDPDYSILKSGIDSSSSGARGVAHLLIKGTDEVKEAITNECEIIYECKICRNLFRSVINFLAHKRLYCQQKFSVSQSFEKDPDVCVVLPKEDISSEVSSPPSKKRNIEAIISNLNPQKDYFTIGSPSKSPLNRLRPPRGNKQEPAVVLTKIDGVSSAVFQTPLSSFKEQPKSKFNNLLEEIAEKKKETMESDSDFISTNESPAPKSNQEFQCSRCNSNFSSQSILDTHLEGKDCVERTVFTCPICSLIFLTVWGCVKHLHKTHKKKKHQRDRLRQVICSRSFKRVLTPLELQNLKLRNGKNISSSDSPKEIPEYSKNTIANGMPPKSKILSIQKICADARAASPPASPNSCRNCNQRFFSSESVKSHFCIHEQPKKKIEIQIRKEYKKEPLSPQLSNNNATPVTSISTELLEKISKFCDVDNLTCMTCDRKYQTITALKRHVANHLGWTRFACNMCSFRSYEKYICSQHCSTAHQMGGKDSGNLVLEEEHFDVPNFGSNLNSTPKIKEEVKEEEVDMPLMGNDVPVGVKD